MGVKFMFDKVKQLGQLKKMRDQAVRIQKQLKEEKIELIENGVRIIITGDQKIKLLEIDGIEDNRIADVINKAVKKSQKAAAKKLQEMSGGLSGMMKGMMG